MSITQPTSFQSYSPLAAPVLASTGPLAAGTALYMRRNTSDADNNNVYSFNDGLSSGLPGLFAGILLVTTTTGSAAPIARPGSTVPAIASSAITRGALVCVDRSGSPVGSVLKSWDALADGILSPPIGIALTPGSTNGTVMVQIIDLDPSIIANEQLAVIPAGAALAVNRFLQFNGSDQVIQSAGGATERYAGVSLNAAAQAGDSVAVARYGARVRINTAAAVTRGQALSSNGTGQAVVATAGPGPALVLGIADATLGSPGDVAGYVTRYQVGV